MSIKNHTGGSLMPLVWSLEKPPDVFEKMSGGF